MDDHIIRLQDATPTEASETPKVEEKTQDTPVLQQGVVDTSTGVAKPTKKPSVHVVPEGLGWKVKESGSLASLFESLTKKEAIQFATTHARNLKTELFIHSGKGKIQSRNSYGNDSKGRG